MRNTILVVAASLLMGCGSTGPQYGDTCDGVQGQSSIIGDQGGCMFCLVGDAVMTPSGNCSAAKNGVYCCTGGQTGGETGGDAKCSVGSCYSWNESMCCPKSARYACNGLCYSYSGGGSCSSYRTTCY